MIDTIDGQYGAGFTRRAGWNIFTTLDLPMQNLAQETVAAKVAELRPTYDLGNAALVAMKPNSGEILAMVGSADFDDESIAGQVNVAVSPRQPGSAIKPVLYAAALDQEAISPATVIWDTRVEYETDAGGGETERYDPRNYDEKYHGPVTVRAALANSYNVPAVKLLDAYGIETMLSQSRGHGHSYPNPWYGLVRAEPDPGRRGTDPSRSDYRLSYARLRRALSARHADPSDLRQSGPAGRV